MPQRIQRKRTKGWRKPEGAVIVDRTTAWGNPFKAGDPGIPDAQTAVDLFEQWCAKNKPKDLDELRGKDLACFCSLDQPCHADVLIRLANS